MAADIERTVAASAALAPWFAGKATGTLWVAFSGGMDSTVLLHVLRQLRGSVAIHIDHGLASNASQWVRHCASVAAEFGIPFQCQRIQVRSGGSVEAACRRARYQALRERLRQGDVLALAHHADDQAETRLWQLFTGRTPGGMPTERPLGQGRLVRPLLGTRRDDIASYAARQRLHWIEDPANDDWNYDRNYIRHNLLPLIEQRFPAAIERLALPRRQVDAVLPPLSTADVSAARVEDWLLRAGLPLVKRAVAEIQRQNDAAQDRNPRVSITPAIEAWRFGAAWHLVRRRSGDSGRQMLLAGEDQALAGGALKWSRASVGLPKGTCLDVRRRCGGERLRPAGRRTKTLKALFRERGVPPWHRDRWPLLYRDDKLVMVPGLAIDASAVVAQGWHAHWTPPEDTLTAFEPL